MGMYTNPLLYSTPLSINLICIDTVPLTCEEMLKEAENSVPNHAVSNGDPSTVLFKKSYPHSALFCEGISSDSKNELMIFHLTSTAVSYTADVGTLVKIISVSSEAQLGGLHKSKPEPGG